SLLGGPHRRDAALHPSGESALRRQRPLQPALSRLRISLVALVILAAVGAGAEQTRVKAMIKLALRWWPERQRARAVSSEPLFTHLAASQVGYAPAMGERFHSPRPFH